MTSSFVQPLSQGGVEQSACTLRATICVKAQCAAAHFPLAAPTFAFCVIWPHAQDSPTDGDFFLKLLYKKVSLQEPTVQG